MGIKCSGVAEGIWETTMVFSTSLRHSGSCVLAESSAILDVPVFPKTKNSLQERGNAGESWQGQMLTNVRVEQGGSCEVHFIRSSWKCHQLNEVSEQKQGSLCFA